MIEKYKNHINNEAIDKFETYCNTNFSIKREKIQ